MSVIVSFGAALRSEKTKTAKRINQCESFTKLCIVSEDLAHMSTHGNVITFECTEYGIDEEHSSSNHGKVFTIESKEGNRVVIRVDESYIPGPPIPGYM